MKTLILEYLKKYNIHVGQLLLSGAKNGYVKIINNPDSSSDPLPFVYTIQTDETETDVYLFCIAEDGSQDKIQQFIKGLKVLIKENSNREIIKSSYDKEWYHWENKHINISFGIRTDKSGFSMRLSFPNHELNNTPDRFFKTTQSL